MSKRYFLPYDVIEVITEILDREDVEKIYTNMVQFYRFSPKQLQCSLNLAQKLDYHAYLPQIWDISKTNSIELNKIAGKFLAILGNAAIPQATELLRSKKAYTRQMGMSLLEALDTAETQKIIYDFLELEPNDDIRDSYVELLNQMISKPCTIEEIKAKIDYAEKRAKLSTPLAPWLDDKEISSVL
jgi:hypothetical protein